MVDRSLKIEDRGSRIEDREAHGAIRYAQSSDRRERSILSPVPLLVVLLACLLLIGCGGAEEAHPRTADGRIPIRLSLLLLSAKETAHFQWAERVYEERNPDVDIIFEQFPGTSLKDFEIKLRLGFRSRNAPDIFHFRENVLIEFKRQGLLAPAPDYIERIVQENSVNELIRSAPYLDGRCYGVVHGADWTALYYNKDMFREAGLDPDRPPETWDELLAYAERLTKYRPDGSVARAGISLRKTGYKPGTAEKWLTFFFSAGGKFLSEDSTRTLIDSPAGRAAMDFYKTVLFEKDLDGVNLESDQQAFGQGLAAMFIREIHVVRWLREHHPDIDFGVALIPRKEVSESGGGSYPVVVSNDSPYKEEAWRFVAFLMSDEVYSRYIEVAEVLPCTRSIASRPQYQEDPYLKVFLQQPVHPPPVVPRIGRAYDILGGYIERFCYGHITADEALERAAREIDALLARNRRDDQAGT